MRRGVLFVLAAVAGYQVAPWLFTNLRGLLGLLFLAWLFAVGIEPIVEALVRRGLRRGHGHRAGDGRLVLAAVGFLAVFGALLVDQLAQLVTVLPDAVVDVVRWVNRTFDTTFESADVVDSLNLTSERVQGLAQDLAPGLVGILSSLRRAGVPGADVPAVRLLHLRRGPGAAGASCPPGSRRGTSGSSPRSGRSRWTRPAATCCPGWCWPCSTPLATGVLLWAIGVPFWLPLAIWTGVVSQFIPTVGTYLAIALPALIALSDQPVDAVWVVLFGTVYQQVENYLIGPRITAMTVDVHPAVAVGAVIAGAALFGPMGALVAIPVVAAVQAVMETYGHGYELVEAEETRPPATVPPERPTGEPWRRGRRR